MRVPDPKLSAATLLVVLLLAPAAPAQDAPARPALPSLAPFRASRFWDTLGDRGARAADLDRLREQIETLYDIKQSTFEAVEEYGPPRIRGAPNAFMEGLDDLEERARWSTVPYALDVLFAMDDLESWSAPHVARAEGAVAVLKGLRRLPRVSFDEGDAARNRKAVRKLADWYLEQLEDPEHFAAMVFTNDDGPFVGLEVEAKKPLPEVAGVPLGADLVLRLADDGDEVEPFVLQCLRGKKVLWSRRVSDSPYRTVSGVAFTEQEPTELDGLGWKVHLVVDYQAGTEYAHLYVDADGGFRCYFMSW